MAKNLFSDRLKALKTLGVAKDIKVKKEFTKAEKSKIYRVWKEFGEIAANKKDFKTLSTKKLSDGDKKKLKDSGYKLHGDSAFIPMLGNGNVTLTKEWTKTKTGAPKHILQIKRTQKIDGELRKVEIEYVGSKLDKLDWRDRLLEQYGKGELKPGEIIALRVYGNNVMQNSYKISIESLIKYAEDIQWNDNTAPVTALQNNLHLVRLWAKNGNFHGTEKSSKEIAKEKRSRAKARKALKVKSNYKGK